MRFPWEWVWGLQCSCASCKGVHARLQRRDMLWERDRSDAPPERRTPDQTWGHEGLQAAGMGRRTDLERWTEAPPPRRTQVRRGQAPGVC